MIAIEEMAAAMNAEFFVLAFTAALNPRLLAVDLLLIQNRRPRAMFLGVLLGGITVGVTIGLLDVLVLQLDAINTQKTVSAGVDLALGLLLLAVGVLVATSRLHPRRKTVAPAQATVPAEAVPIGAASRTSQASGRKTAGHACWPSPGSGWPCWPVRYAASPVPST